MTSQEIAAVISIARRAPLANMSEAEAVAQLLQKLAAYFAPVAEHTEPLPENDSVEQPTS